MKRAFTLIEILVSIILLTIVMLGLYSVLKTQRRSVSAIKHHLDKSLNNDKAIMVLYNDILKSDGNITIINSQKDTICLNSTTNSLYGLDIAKVCWLVLKNEDTLIRIEGNNYKLPLGLEDKVEIDSIAKGVNLFDITRDKKGNILVVMQYAKNEPYSFLLQGIKEPPKPPKKKPKKKQKKRNIKKDTNKTKEHNKTQNDLF